MHALAEHYKIDPNSHFRPPDYSLLLDAPTRRLIYYSYTALSLCQRVQLGNLFWVMEKRR